MQDIYMELWLNINGEYDECERVLVANHGGCEQNVIEASWFCEATCKHVCESVWDLEDGPFDLEAAKAVIIKRAYELNRYANYIYID